MTLLVAALALSSPAAPEPTRLVEPDGPALGRRAPMQQADLEPLIRRYTTDLGSVGSFYNVAFSEAGLKRREEFFNAYLKELERQDFERLARDGKVDAILLRNELRHELKQAAFARARNLETAPLTPFGGRIVALEERRWRVEPLDPEKAAEELVQIQKEVKEVRKQVQAGIDKKSKPDQPADGKAGTRSRTLEPPSPELAFRAANVTRDLAGILDRWFKHYDGFKPLFSWWARSPYEATKKELADYDKFLRQTVAGVKEGEDDPLIGDPIGRQALLDDLEHEMIAYTPEELIQIAEREFAWCEAEMKKASREMGFGDDWKKALEKVKEDHVPPGEQDNLVAKLAREAIAFLDKHDLVTIEQLARETWRVDMLDARGQRSLPFAAYGGQRMLVASPLDSMDHETKLMSMRGNNIHFTKAITHHELIPGHHLQGYMAQRYRSYRQVFGTPFLGEGWALYWEMLLYRLGFAETPENRIGMMFWRMHRAARIIVSLRFHLGTMKPQEMIDFLVDRVGHERFTATSEVRRFIGGQYSPLYQCAYMIGGLQLRALAEELTGFRFGDGDTRSARAGVGADRRSPIADRLSLKTFHDAVLRLGPIPVDMIRASLTALPLEREYRTTWRFATE